jgi:hypothetical protein
MYFVHAPRLKIRKLFYKSKIFEPVPEVMNGFVYRGKLSGIEA